MRKIKYLLFIVIFLHSCENERIEYQLNKNSVEKHFVTIDEIKQIVASEKFENFLSKIQNIHMMKKGLSKNVDPSLEITDYLEYKDKNGVTAFYLVKLSNNNLTIFAADDRSHVVMGITDSAYSSAITVSVPPEFSYWLEDEIGAIEFARDNNIQQTEEVKLEWISYKIPMPDPSECTSSYFYSQAPFLTTTWGQGVGYNDYTPHLNCQQYSNGNAPAGCVAVAAAQVMKYFQYPNTYNWGSM